MTINCSHIDLHFDLSVVVLGHSQRFYSFFDMRYTRLSITKSCCLGHHIFAIAVAEELKFVRCMDERTQDSKRLPLPADRSWETHRSEHLGSRPAMWVLHRTNTSGRVKKRLCLVTKRQQRLQGVSCSSSLKTRLSAGLSFPCEENQEDDHKLGFMDVGLEGSLIRQTGLAEQSRSPFLASNDSHWSYAPLANLNHVFTRVQ